MTDRIEKTVELAAPIDRVWRAITDHEEFGAWFRVKLDGPFHLGEPSTGRITYPGAEHYKWEAQVTRMEPPHHFACVERAWMEGAPPVATEITIIARAGGQCTVRMVHSLFASSDDWDDQLEGFEGGWPGFFDVLRIYLAHFAGQSAASFQAMGSTAGEQLAVWKRLTESLALAGADVEEQRTTPQAPERLSGIVERVQQTVKQRYMMLRLTEPAPGVVLLGTYRAGERTNASMAMYFYGDDAAQRAAASEPKWRDWFAATFK